MIHCVCNNINTAKVDACAAKGMNACGTKFNCGQCRESINARLEQWRSENAMLEAAE